LEVKLSHRVQAVRPSPTLAVNARARTLKAEGRDILDLSAGEPDFDTPDFVKAAAIRAIEEGFTKYTAVDGTAELKRAIVEKLHRENALDYGVDQVLVSVGCKHSIYNLMQSVLNPGDEVVVPAPFWVSYPDMAKLAGAEATIIRTGAEQAFKVSREQLRGAITERTRMVIINSPSNPTGAVYSREELAELATVLEDYPDLLIASDDIYEHVRFTGLPFVNILNVAPKLAERTVVLNGVSKSYAMTGWRIGYAAGPANVIKAMTKVQSQSTSSPTSIAQVAAATALAGDMTFIQRQNEEFAARHVLVRDALNAMPGVECLGSAGTFYIFPNFQQVIDRLPGVDNDIELGEWLLEHAGCALVPGSAFGAPGYMRISFATSREVLTAAMERLHAALERAFAA
jgi:aspartate aminotransferase